MNIWATHAISCPTRLNMAARCKQATKLLALSGVLLFGFANVAFAAEADQERKELNEMAQSTLADLYRQQPEAKQVVGRAAGYAVFSNFGMKLLVGGTGKGKGVAVNNTSKQTTYMKALELQAGLGFGIKKYRLVWVFESAEAFDKFVSQGRQLGGQADFSAQTAKQGAGVAGAASVDKGVWLYQLTDKGLAAEITVKASKYYKDKDLN